MFIKWNISSNITPISEKCTGLPEIDNLKTESEFSIDYGTLVTVSCEEGYKHQGDQILQCIENQDFNFDNKPTCIKS